MHAHAHTHEHAHAHAHAHAHTYTYTYTYTHSLSLSLSHKNTQSNDMGACVRGWRAHTQVRAFELDPHAEFAIGVTTALGKQPSGIHLTAALPVTPDREGHFEKETIGRIHQSGRKYSENKVTKSGVYFCKQKLT